MAGTLHEAVLQGAKDVWTDDVNQLGTDADSKVRGFLFKGDPEIRRGVAGEFRQAPPLVWIEFQEDQVSPVGADEAGGVLTFHVITDEDRGLSDQRKIAGQIKEHYHEQSIQSAAVTALNWSLSRPVRLRGFQAPSTGKYNHWIEQFSVRGTATA
jgi:hypothetical protein